MNLEKLSIEELKDLSSEIDSLILNKESVFEIKEEETKTYYMHSISCDIVDFEITDFKFKNAEYTENLTEEEFINDKYNEIYLDDENNFSFIHGNCHVSLYTELPKATKKERLLLEETFYNEIKKHLIKKLEYSIKKYTKKVITQKSKLSVCCKNYLREEKLKRLEK